MSVFTVSDIHGCYEIWKQIEDYLLPTDELYVIGDVIDRDPNGFLIYEEMVTHDNIHIIKGNHEEMALAALEQLAIGNYRHKDVDFWFDPQNGGKESWETIKDLPKEYLYAFIDFFKGLPEQYEYENANGQYIILNHCGFTPYKKYWRYEDREHFKDQWPEKDVWKDVVVVHGHTTVDTMLFYCGFYKSKSDNKYRSSQANRANYKENYVPEMITYCDGHKINIDMGLPWSNVCCLLDLDTLKPIYFEREVSVSAECRA